MHISVLSSSVINGYIIKTPVDMIAKRGSRSPVQLLNGSLDTGKGRLAAHHTGRCRRRGALLAGKGNLKFKGIPAPFPIRPKFMNERESIHPPVVEQISPYISQRQLDELPVVVVSHPKVRAAVCLQGAHLLAYQPSGEQPVIWLSNNTPFKDGVAIRGGVPICWPWFNTSSDTPQFQARATYAGQGYKAWASVKSQQFDARAAAAATATTCRCDCCKTEIHHERH